MASFRQRHTEFRLSRYVWVAAIAIALLVGVSAFSLFAVLVELRQARESHVDVQRTSEILAGLQRVLSAMQDAETGERGFLLTGSEAFLDPYNTASHSLDGLLRDLDTRVKDAESRAMLIELQRRSQEQMNLLHRVVALRRAGEVAAATGIVATGIGKRQMDRIRDLVTGLQARQQSLLNERLARFRDSSHDSERVARFSLSTTTILALLSGVLLARNYHRRRLAERANLDQAVRLGTILDNIADAIVTINESGSIESWSHGAEVMFGYTEAEVLRRNVSILMPDPHASAHDGYLRRYIATGEKRIMNMRRELEAKHKDGHRFPIELAVSEMRLNDRRLFIGSMRDISMRLEVERLKSGFVATVSHELRTPLTSISGSLGLVAAGATGPLPDKAQRFVEIALSNSKRLVRLINDILDLEKTESGKMEFSLEPLQIKSLVQLAIDMNRGYAHTLGVSVELEPCCDDAWVLVDRDRLTQVLLNLLSNAVKFSPRDEIVRVHIQNAPDSVRVEVRDRGPGIAPEFQKRIFQKFAQGDSTDSRAKGGTGLGLSISKSLIERLGGSIGFHSTPGQGTTFYFTLPMHVAPAEPAAYSNVEFSPRVLLCEDDPDLAGVLCELLSHNGMQVKVAATAEAVRLALRSEQFDVAVVDLDLPDADGIQLVSELRSRESTLPVIISSGRARSSIDPRGLADLNLADWVQKPADPKRLIEAIRTSVGAE